MFENLKTPYRIETARTLLACWDLQDARMMQEAVSESVDSLLPFLPWAKGEPFDWHAKLAVIRRFRSRFDAGQECVMGIFEKDRSVVLGGTGLHFRGSSAVPEIGYWIRRSRQNRGLATEVTRALLKTAFELSSAERVEIFCDVRNAASVRVIEKAGFRDEGTKRHAQKDSEGTWQDLRTWSMLRAEYTASDLTKEPVSAWNEAGEKIL